MNLLNERVKANVSQITIAAKIGVSLNTYINWERGVTKPNEENEKKLNDVLEELNQKG